MADQTTVKIARDYAWLINLAATDPSMADFMRRVQAYVKKVNGDPTSVQTWISQNLPKTTWAQTRTSAQQQAEMQMNDPRFKADWEASLESRRAEISDMAAGLGVTLDDSELDFLAKEARLEGWDQATTQRKLRPYLEADIAAGSDLRGTAGDFQTELMQWAAKNGLKLGSAANAYVQRMTLGEQSIDDVKQEIRQTYMAGMFPAWADKINAGMDIADLAAPYKATMADLLEIDDNQIGWDDATLNAGLQATNQDGKPVMMPIYEYKNLIRKDPRWQKTDNAYATYANVAQNILRTFGFA